MSIDYSEYTLDELTDVHERIDRERYPERYQLLRAEIEKRTQLGEFKNREQEVDKDDQSFDFVIEFSTDERASRVFFIAAFSGIYIALLAFIVPKYFVTDIADIHQYTTDVSAAMCKREVVEHDDNTSIYFDFYLTSYQDTFVAYGIGKGLCFRMAKELSEGMSVSVWHDDGAIFQLASSERMLLSYKYMKPILRAMQTQGIWHYWFWMLAVFLLLYKSLANAIKPNSYTSLPNDSY